MTEGGDDLELEALASSQFAVPPLRWMVDQAPAFPTPPRRRRKLSLFERLPAEIRHEIYKWLDFPVGRRLWIDCFAAWCNDPAHPHSRTLKGHPTQSSTDTDSSNDDEPHFEPCEGYQHRKIVDTIVFREPEGWLDTIQLCHNADTGWGSGPTVPCRAPWAPWAVCSNPIPYRSGVVADDDSTGQNE